MSIAGRQVEVNRPLRNSSESVTISTGVCVMVALGRWKNDNQHHRNPNSFHSFVPSVESCDFECDFSHLIEAQIHELMHIIDFRLADIFNASIRNF